MNNNADQKHRGVGILLNIHEEKGRAFKIKIERIKNQCLFSLSYHYKIYTEWF
jgi:hypothetical protein